MKCPGSEFNVTPTDATSDNRLCLYMENGVAKLKKDHEYYDQVQGKMVTTETKWCDSVVYTTLGLNIECVYFYAEHWKNKESKQVLKYIINYIFLY